MLLSFAAKPEVLVSHPTQEPGGGTMQLAGLLVRDMRPVYHSTRSRWALSD